MTRVRADHRHHQRGQTDGCNRLNGDDVPSRCRMSRASWMQTCWRGGILRSIAFAVLVTIDTFCEAPCGAVALQHARAA